MNWSEIIAYISTKDAGLVSSFRGVSPQDIRVCEQRYGVTLPASYVDFLKEMGEDSGRLEPLGLMQRHCFSELMSSFPPEGYPADRLFQVSYETDESALAFLGKFIDLTDADANDARLVEFEPGDASVPVSPGDFTFGETVVQEIFTQLELYMSKYAASVLLHSESTDHGLRQKRMIGDLLVRLGFTSVMPEMERIACFRRDTLSAMVLPYRSFQTVTLNLGSDHRPALQEFLPEVIASVPGSTLLEDTYELRE